MGAAGTDDGAVEDGEMGEVEEARLASFDNNGDGDGEGEGEGADDDEGEGEGEGEFCAGRSPTWLRGTTQCPTA